MKKHRLIVVILLLILSTYSYASEVKRKLLVILPEQEYPARSSVHHNLESILNYYGFYCEYIVDKGNNYPKNTEEYAGLIYWNQGLKSPNPLILVNYFTKFKEKKLILIGDIPIYDKNDKPYFDKINSILKTEFQFGYSGFWKENPENLDINFDEKLFNFEAKLSFLNQKYFTQIETFSEDIEIAVKEKYLNRESNSTIFAPWGFYSPIYKVFQNIDDGKIEGKNRWIINPFKMVEKVFNINYPIPDTTTINGKRVGYIHIDGDGILSKTFDQRYTIDLGYEFIKQEKLKTGVSFIVSELDKNGPILKNAYTQNGTKLHDYKLLNSFAKKTFDLPFVEPASHTYSHPFNWRKGIVAYSSNKNAKPAIYEDISAFQEPDHQVNLELEIKHSIDYLQNLTSKKINSVYWSGDCYPSLRDLQYIEKNNLLAFNGGDSRFDLEYNSYSYVTPLSLYSPKGTQIYSSNSNENTYTELWTNNYWRFKNVIKTFENTGYPKRIKPVNTYYHYYSFAKKSSYSSLKKIYDYMKKENLEFIYPSEFIKIAKNFHDIKISKENNIFTISNIKDLREFRFEGKIKIASNDLSNYFYDKKLNVTYVRIKQNLKTASLKVLK